MIKRLPLVNGNSPIEKIETIRFEDIDYIEVRTQHRIFTDESFPFEIGWPVRTILSFNQLQKSKIAKSDDELGRFDKVFYSTFSESIEVERCF